MTNLDIIFKKEKYYSAYKGLSSQKYVFSVVMCTNVRVGPHKEVLSTKELMLSNCVATEDSL